MDTTENNVVICEKAEEIRKKCKYEEGDVFYTPFKYNDESGGSQASQNLITMLKNIGGRRYYGYAMKSYGFEVGSVFSEDPHGRLYKLEDVVWLPRQDQLQEMIVKVVDYETTAELEGKFHKFLVWLDEWDFASMEQLWLAFVMKEKYNKSWNGKEWVEND